MRAVGPFHRDDVVEGPREDTGETTLTPARPAHIPTPALRTSHFSDPPDSSLRPRCRPPLDTEACPVRISASAAEAFHQLPFTRHLRSVLARYRPQYDALRQQAPALAATIVPILEAYPATAERMQRVRLPARLPVVDIYAEHSWAETPESAAAMRRAHIAFAAAGRHRESVYAAGSSHQVMRDRPDIVLAAIARAVAQAGH